MANTRQYSLLLSLEFLLVELKLSTFEDVSITSSGLTWSGGDASEDSSGVELIGNSLFDDSSLGVLLGHGGSMSGLLELGSGGIALFNLLLVELNVVMLQVPLSERIGIDGDNAVLDDGLGSDELVVGCVVDDIKNSSLSSDGLRSPGEVSDIDSEGSPFKVSTSASDWSDSFCAQLGVCSWSTHLELSLFLMNWHSSSGMPSLVSRVSVNSHDPDEPIATLYNNDKQYKIS